MTRATSPTCSRPSSTSMPGGPTAPPCASARSWRANIGRAVAACPAMTMPGRFPPGTSGRRSGSIPNAGQPYYYIASPLFARSTIRLESGRSFAIEAVRWVGPGDLRPARRAERPPAGPRLADAQGGRRGRAAGAVDGRGAVRLGGAGAAALRRSGIGGGALGLGAFPSRSFRQASCPGAGLEEEGPKPRDRYRFGRPFPRAIPPPWTANEVIVDPDGRPAAARFGCALHAGRAFPGAARGCVRSLPAGAGAGAAMRAIGVQGFRHSGWRRALCAGNRPLQPFRPLAPRGQGRRLQPPIPPPRSSMI